METKVTSAVYDNEESRPDALPLKSTAHSSGIAWGAVIGGGFVAAAFSLILLALGAGFGLSVVSPWSGVGASASTVGRVAIAWLIAIEVVASGLGGYLTGRLRTKWALIHTDEVHFRDTANGFLSWAVALVIGVTLLTSAAASMAGSVVQLRSPAAPAGAVGIETHPNKYLLDRLFRSDSVGAKIGDESVRAEAEAVFANSLRQNQIPTGDLSYLARMIAATTGVTQAKAEERVSDAIAQARQTEDTARKETAHALLWVFLALLTGAFSASYAATIGGRQRDCIKAV